MHVVRRTRADDAAMEHILKDTNPNVETQFCADDDAYTIDRKRTGGIRRFWRLIEVRENQKFL